MMSWHSLLKPTDLLRRKSIYRICKRIFPFHASAWSAAREPVNAFLNETDVRLRDVLTQTWRDNMIWHLNIVIITSSVVSNLISAAFGWQYFEHDNVRATCPRIVKAAWFSALMMSVSSIAAASQQLVALHRLSTYPNSHAVIRRLLMGAADCSSVVGASSPASTDTAHVRISVKTKSNKHKKQMSLRQAFLWQVPVSLLDGSLYFFIGGLSIIVYFDFSETVKGSSFWSAFPLAFIFTVLMLLSLSSYITSSLALYHWIEETQETQETQETGEGFNLHLSIPAGSSARVEESPDLQR